MLICAQLQITRRARHLKTTIFQPSRGTVRLETLGTNTSTHCAFSAQVDYFWIARHQSRVDAKREDPFLQAITNRRHPDHLAMERLRSAVNSSAHKDAFRPLDTRTLLAVTIARALRLEVDSHSHGDLVACEHH